MGTAVSKRKELAKALILDIMDDLESRTEDEIYAAVASAHGIGPKAVRAALSQLQRDGKIAYSLETRAWCRVFDDIPAEPDLPPGASIFEPYADGGISIKTDLYFSQKQLEAMPRQRLNQITSAAHVLLTAQAELAGETPECSS